jgi:hypothetical protein
MVVTPTETSMGSKRPEQIHKDLLATDQKTRTADEHIHEEDKQRLNAEKEQLGAPKRGENPALTALKESRIPKSSDGS